MSEEMQKEAIAVATKSFQDFKEGKYRAANIKREFDKNLVSLYPMLRARSLASGPLTQAAKKERISESTYVVTKFEEVTKPTLQNWFTCFDLVSNTWAVAGVHKVPWGGKSIPYCHWQDAEAYMFEFKEKHLELLGKHPDRLVYLYLTSVEEMFRAQAITLARGAEQVPWGVALNRSLKENAHLWERHHHLLGSENKVNFVNKQEPRETGFDRKKKQKAPKAQKCTHYNAGKCNRGDDCNFIHACNAVLRNGNLCGKRHRSSDHTRNDGQLKFNGGQGKGGGGKRRRGE